MESNTNASASASTSASANTSVNNVMIDEHISFSFDENNENNENTNTTNATTDITIMSDIDITNVITKLLNQDSKEVIVAENDDESNTWMPQILNYQLNFTVRQLMQICEYYGIAKDIKANKFNKDETIQMLVAFEHDIENAEIVCKRQLLWFYIDELKNDKYMKRFIIM